MSMNQADHYDTILSEYEKHYYDEQALNYRRKFIYPYLFDGMDLDGKRVIELACGSGFNTNELLRLFPRVEISGLDISPGSCEAFRRNTGRDAIVYDLTAPEEFPFEPADHAFVVGGLHHCVSNLEATFNNIAKMIRPGGYLLMVEPNANFFLNRIRTFWYRKDRWFQEQDEAPLSHMEISRMTNDKFIVEQVSYLGGPAYFLILNSLITRIPVSAKGLIAPMLFSMDNIYNKIHGERPFPMFIARWRRI